MRLSIDGSLIHLLHVNPVEPSQLSIKSWCESGFLLNGCYVLGPGAPPYVSGTETFQGLWLETLGVQSRQVGIDGSLRVSSEITSRAGGREIAGIRGRKQLVLCAVNNRRMCGLSHPMIVPAGSTLGPRGAFGAPRVGIGDGSERTQSAGGEMCCCLWNEALGDAGRRVI